jgi:hypothetical protein
MRGEQVRGLLHHRLVNQTQEGALRVGVDHTQWVEGAPARHLDGEVLFEVSRLQPPSHRIHLKGSLRGTVRVSIDPLVGERSNSSGGWRCHHGDTNMLWLRSRARG